MTVHSRRARLVFTPAFHLHYTYGSRYTPSRADIVPEQHEALLSGRWVFPFLAVGLQFVDTGCSRTLLVRNLPAARAPPCSWRPHQPHPARPLVRRAAPQVGRRRRGAGAPERRQGRGRGGVHRGVGLHGGAAGAAGGPLGRRPRVTSG
jgi:hypothetical protein